MQNNDSNKVNVLVRLGFLLVNIGELNIAEKHAIEALRISDSIHFTNGIAKAYMLTGNIYRLKLGEPEGLKYYYKALKLLEFSGDKRQLAVCFQLIGFSNYWQENYDEAYRVYHKCLKLSREINYSYGIVESLTYLVNEYYNKNDYDGVLKTYSEVLKVSENTNNVRGIGYANSGFEKYWSKMSEISIASGNYLLAKDYLSRSEKYNEAAAKNFEEVNDFGAAGDVYNRHASINIKQGRFAKAAVHLKKALEYAEKSGYNDNFKNAYKTLSELDSAKGNFKKAYDNFKMYVLYRDKMFNQENTKKALQANAQYELDKKDAEAKAAQNIKDVIYNSNLQKQKIIRNSFIAGSIFLLLLIVILINRNKLKRTVEMEKMRSRLSRDLHDDIGSTLSSINILSRTAQSNLKQTTNEKTKSALEKINERSQRLLDSMSDIIWNINPGNDTIEEVMSRMREYATTILEAKNIDYTFNFPKEKMDCKLTMEVKNNMYLIFKEAVNNLSKYSGCSKVSLSLLFDEKNIQLIVEDNGIGFDTNKQTQGGGLINMNYRAAEIKGALRINSTPGRGTSVEVTMPRYC